MSTNDENCWLGFSARAKISEFKSTQNWHLANIFHIIVYKQQINKQMIDLRIFIFYTLTMSIYKKHIENMRLFYLVAMETDLDSCISYFFMRKLPCFCIFRGVNWKNQQIDPIFYGNLLLKRTFLC